MQRRCIHCMAEIGNEVLRCPKCNTLQEAEVPSHRLLPGTILNDRYFIGETLGEGGFGITYIGYDNLFERTVAIKEYFPKSYVSRNNTVSPEVHKNVTEDRKVFVEKGLKKFLDEAKVLARFQKTDGIVSVYDFFEKNGTAYIVMEYLRGITLKSYIETNGCIPAKNLIQLMMPVMKTLDEVHKSNLIHRDISPDNIMFVEGDTNIKLLDFGAARDYSAQDGVSMSIMLKPGYAPEEQYRRRGQQGPWTDVYALCATMYKCITGIRPEEATDRVVEDDIKTISELGVQIDPNIEQAIMKGLNVFAKDRYTSVTELLNALQSASPIVKKDNTKPKVMVEPQLGYTEVIGKDIRKENVVSIKPDIKSEKTAPVFVKVQKEDNPSTITIEEEEERGSKKSGKKKKTDGKKNKPLIIIAAAVFMLFVFLFALGQCDSEVIDISDAINVEELSNGYKIVQMKDCSGVMDKDNNIVISFDYDYVDTLDEENTLFCVSVFDEEKNKTVRGACNLSGELIVPLEYEYLYYEENGSVKVKNYEKKFGIYNQSGEFVIPAEYEHISSASDGWMAEAKGGKCGAYDLQGKLVVPLEYKQVTWNEALKLWYVTTFDERTGAYDSTGELVIPIG